MPFAGRVIVPEKLDFAEPMAARRSLEDLVRINRYFGAHRVLRSVMQGIAGPEEAFTVLDVGAASGDMGASIRRLHPQAVVTSLDHRACHLKDAKPPKVAGDAFQLPFRPGSFDFVFSSLFLHHFTDAQVMDLFTGFRGLARRAVVAIDLDRGPLAPTFLASTKWLFGWHDITVHDGKLSFDAAFKAKELLSLARAAGLAQARVRVHRPWARLSLVAPV